MSTRLIPARKHPSFTAPSTADRSAAASPLLRDHITLDAIVTLSFIFLPPAPPLPLPSWSIEQLLNPKRLFITMLSFTSHTARHSSNEETPPAVGGLKPQLYSYIIGFELIYQQHHWVKYLQLQYQPLVQKIIS